MTDGHVTREADMNTEDAGGCPVHAGRLSHPTEGGGNVDWWPNQLNLRVLRTHVADMFANGEQDVAVDELLKVYELENNRGN